MKRFVALAMGIVLSASVSATKSAASAGSSAPPKHQLGLKNSKKAMQAKRERDKLVHEAKKQGHARRQQAHGGR